MTFEQDLDKFGGAALNRVHYDEEPPEQIRKECQDAPHRPRRGRALHHDPPAGMSWMFDGVYERRDEPGSPSSRWHRREPPPRPSLEYLAQAIKHKRAEWGISPDYSVIDPSARNRAVTIEADRIEAELQRFGIFCIHGQNDQEAGAFQIKRRLQAEPEPALLIAQNLRECIHELKRARIKETEDGSFKLLKEASPNARNEVIDALRYGLMSRPWAFVPQRDAPSNRGWKPDWAPPYEWFEDRRGRTAPPMGSFT
jgi:phage terminase large subunit-like protein